MKNIFWKISTVLLLVLFYSCGTSVSHDQAVKYYNSIGHDVNESTGKTNDFIHQLFERTKVLMQSDDKKLAPNEIDTLKKSYDEALAVLNSKIDDLSKINEIDSDINLKENVLNHLNEVKDFFEKSIPYIMDKENIGLNNIVELQRVGFANALESFKKKINELQASSDELQQLEINFQNKYNLTNEEITN
jgi:Skp family chaperone for outer membrane proteins